MSWDSRNLRCFNCRSWWPLAEAAGHEPTRQHAKLGECRRYAPPAHLVDAPEHGGHYPSWAITKRDDWCNEHAHTEM